MPYSKNPYLPEVGMEAVNLVYQGWSTRKVARYFGVGSETVSKWLKRDCGYGLRPIPTLSSRPPVGLEIPEYLHYYNNQRLHLSLNLKTSIQCVQVIG